MADAVAAARLGQQIGGVGHASMPPATSTSWVPATSMSCANMAARMPEPHILDRVNGPALLGRPPLNAAWRARGLALASHQAVAEDHFGDQLRAMPARSTAALMATPPRSCAAKEAKSLWKLPMGCGRR